MLTEDDNNHFTSYDVLCALKTYHYQEESAYRRRMEFVANSTGIPLKENRRNGRKQKDHLRRARLLQKDDYPDGEWRNTKGAPTAKEKVATYRAEHPEANVTEIARALGISRTTVYKWWDSYSEPLTFTPGGARPRILKPLLKQTKPSKSLEALKRSIENSDKS